jgi:F0F1-type ATP synthase assembly protein I
MTFAGAAIFLAICGYLVTNFFNDSVVGIAPIFWVLLGLGFICNKMVRKQNASV